MSKQKTRSTPSARNARRNRKRAKLAHRKALSPADERARREHVDRMAAQLKVIEKEQTRMRRLQDTYNLAYPTD